MGKISRTRGKNAELGVARYLGAKRQHFEKEDLEHPVLSIQVKHRKQLPKSLVDWMSQAESDAANGKIPCAVLHEERQRYEDSLVVLRLRDLKKILG